MFKFRKDGIRRYKNTSATGDNLGFCVSLYGTDIVKGVEFGAALLEITLNSGGWQTATIKKRMNEIADELGLGFQVCQVQGVWHVFLYSTERGWKESRLPFADGMTFTCGRRHLEA